MEFSYRYHGHSAMQSGANDTQMHFAPDTLREPTFFVAELAQHLLFREGMSVLHHVVESDLRFQPKNRDDYFAWLAQEESNMLAELGAQQDSIKAEVGALRQALNNIYQEKQHIMQPFYKAQNRYFNYLYKNDYNAWFVLDPVITVHPDSVFFECFSQDESTYGKLSCDLSVFKRIDDFACGTTNIDYSADLYNEFQKIRDYKTTEFCIDPDGFSVQTTQEDRFIEQKIDLPDSWVRGFLQVSSAMTLPSVTFSLSPVDIHNFCFVLKRQKERHGPRAIRFMLTPNQPIQAIFEPWDKVVTCPRSIYTGETAREIRLWGRRRLLLLERLIPVSNAFHVHLLGSGLPAFFEADMGDMTFTLGLSGWTANDWAKVSHFDLMAPRAEVAEITVEQVFTTLKRHWFATADALASEAGLARATVLAALHILTQAGRVIYDLKHHVYRLRELSREPLPLETLRFSNEREAKADNFVNANLVTLSEAKETAEQLILSGTVMDNANTLETMLVLDSDERLVDGHCQCHFYVSNKLYKGPCEHMLALRRYHANQQQTDKPLGRS